MKNSDSLQQLCSKYGKKLSNHEQKEQSLKDEIEKRQKSLESHSKKYPHWGENLIKPIAEELLQFFPNRYYEILGPFGLSCEMSIHFYKNKGKNVEYKKHCEFMQNEPSFCKSITFKPGDLEKGELVIVDYKKNTGKYKKGTIGEINGFNHPEIALPKTIQELRKYVR